MNLLKIRKSMKGFTLVELLIVIVILGILAALLLPRLAAQPEKAVIAEGVNTLGAVRRAQINISDASPGANYLALTSASSDTSWRVLGITNPSAAGGTPAFQYTCASGTPSSSGGTLCTAKRVNRTINTTAENSPYAGSTFTIDIDTGAFAVGAAGSGGKAYQLDTSGRVTT